MTTNNLKILKSAANVLSRAGKPISSNHMQNAIEEISELREERDKLKEILKELILTEYFYSLVEVFDCIPLHKQKEYFKNVHVKFMEAKTYLEELERKRAC